MNDLVSVLLSDSLMNEYRRRRVTYACTHYVECIYISTSLLRDVFYSSRNVSSSHD